MLVTVDEQSATEIDNTVIEKILNIYPEEELILRPAFQKGFSTNKIKLSTLKAECSKILIPWQLFFLELPVLEKTLQHIESQRQYRVSSKLFTKRKGLGAITSKRIIDRLIRQQNYLTQSTNFDDNPFVGAIKYKSVSSAAKYILDYFEFDRDKYQGYKNAEAALNHFISQIDQKNINVCRGVIANKILPNPTVVHSDLYKNTSGFVIQDKKVPFIFLPSEINPDEVDARQLYSLVYLLVVIGLNQYEYILDSNFRAKMFRKNKMNNRIHAITSEILIPTSFTNELSPKPVSEEYIRAACSKLKVTPSALLTTLKLRKLISQSEYDAYKPSMPPQNNRNKASVLRTPKHSTSIKKFCGDITYDAIVLGVRSRRLTNVRAQYLIYGAIYKKGFLSFRKELGI